jgi:AraC-like DNA-binding protein
MSELTNIERINEEMFANYNQMQHFIVLIHNNVDFAKRLKSHLYSTTIVMEKKKIKALSQEIRIKPISCIILYVEHNIPDEFYFELVKRKFPYIPWIAILAHHNIKLAHYCGAKGIERVLLYEDVNRIEDEIASICAVKNNKVSLVDIGINKEKANYSIMVQDALSFIERYYTIIFTINEIVDIAGIDQATLSREFVKFDLPGPKKILMYMKVRHAIKLMHSQGLNIREISSLSGFTHEKRMAECFHRIFGMSPGEYRQKNQHKLNNTTNLHEKISKSTIETEHSYS